MDAIMAYNDAARKWVETPIRHPIVGRREVVSVPQLPPLRPADRHAQADVMPRQAKTHSTGSVENSSASSVDVSSFLC
jgi:hypothetical protein